MAEYVTRHTLHLEIRPRVQDTPPPLGQGVLAITADNCQRFEQAAKTDRGRLLGTCAPLNYALKGDPLHVGSEHW